MEKGQSKDHQSLAEVFKIISRTKPLAYRPEVEITTDHMVAKVRYVATRSTKAIWIFWGDFESDKISVYNKLDLTHSPEFGIRERPSHSTYTLFHVYDVPKGGREFKKHVSVRIQDHSGRTHHFSKTINLTPPSCTTIE